MSDEKKLNKKDLSELSNEVLVSMAKDKNDKAINELIVRFSPSIRKRAESFSNAVSEDLVQEGYMAMMSAVRNYNPNNQAGFSTYVTKCVKNRMITAYKRCCNYNFEEVSDEDNIYDPDEIPENIVVDREQYSEIFRKIKVTLSDLEMEVFHLYITGISYELIADKLSIDVKAVDNAIQRVRKKLKTVVSK